MTTVSERIRKSERAWFLSWEATVSTKEKTTEGKPVIVSDVVAQGPIAEVNGKRVTICSSRNNPIVSRRAAKKEKKHDTKVNVRVVQ